MTKKYIVKGLVQGIGYRPFVAKIADELHIDGWVRNTGGIVTVQASGDERSLQKFLIRLQKEVPTGGFVSSVEVIDIQDGEIQQGFSIIESDVDVEANLPLIPADIATCDDCKAELLDASNRRYKHPFISCTICGPRYSIIEKLPYDRDTITMADFEMCPECEAEYTGKNDRRRHAQTIACKSCGPKLEFNGLKRKKTDNIINSDNVDNYVENYNENDLDGEITASVKLITQGGILAIKDIGGYHLACDPFNKEAVDALRILKHREAKAFAVMFKDVEQVKKYCKVSKKEKELLESPARPIVLLRRKKSFPQNVCLTSPDIGAMLPCNPVQIMLVNECGPLIMTSGNASGDVLEIDNKRMKKWLKARVDSGELGDTPVGMLSHNRRILRPMDDSVMKVVAGRQQFVRRGRGHVPNPISVDIPGEIFAAGGDLKSSFCYLKNGFAYVSQYLGDLESVSCQKFYKNEMTAMEKIFGFKPKSVVTDMHPAYYSRRMGEELAAKKKVPIKHIQHHKAHVLSVIAEHNLKGPVLGFAFDGTGFGEDGTVWGSEVFLWDGKSRMDKVADIRPSRLIGGDEGAKNCDTILVGILHEIGLDELIDNPTAKFIRTAIDSDINVVSSTSMGRLFDAVSAMLDICHYNTYEGQAPIELENIAAKTKEIYPLCFGENGSTEEIFLEIANAITHNVPRESIARGFIYAVADYILEMATIYSERLGREKQIVLSGGTFLNRILLERTIELLEAENFKVYISEQLPPGDGGICLGQLLAEKID